MCADSAEGSNERAGDLGIAVPLRHQVENPPFPRRRPGRPLWAALASPVGLLEVRPERWMSPSRRYLTPCGPKTRHRGRIGRWAGLTEPQFFGMAGPASSVRPSSSSPTSARRSRSVRDAEEDTEFSRYKSRRPNRTSPTIPPPVPGGNPPFGEWSLDRWPVRLDQRGRRRNVPVRRAAREQRSSPRRGAPLACERTAEGKGLVHAPVPLGSPGSSAAVGEQDMLEAARRAKLVRGLEVAAATDSRPNLWLRRHQLAQLAPHRRAPRRRIMPA